MSDLAMLLAMVDDCERLADKADEGTGCIDQLATEVARLRAAFDHHARAHPLRPTFDRARLVRTSCDAGPIGELRATLATLRDHLTARPMHLIRAC